MAASTISAATKLDSRAPMASDRGTSASAGPRLGSPALLGLAGGSIAIGLFLWGMWCFPLAVLGPDRAMVPGDMGDARFNNHVLEHFHQYATGGVEDYWNAPFMHPWPNVIAYSDNLLGTAPLYSLFRSVGWNRESAFQLWAMALFALNYWCCFLALRAWAGAPVLAACGAFIFAFGIHHLGQMDHAQVFPRFMVPVAVWAWWRVLTRGGLVHWLFAVLAVVYQFWCGIYLGLFLMYGLLVMAVAHVLVHRPVSLPIGFRNTRSVFGVAAVLIAGLVLLVPLMMPYLRASAGIGELPYAEASRSIPRPLSHFFSHEAALSWQDLSRHGWTTLPDWWQHHLFAGATPWLALLLVPFLLRARNSPPERERPIAFAAVALLLVLLLCMDFGGHSPWRAFHALPGFSAIRSVDRVINVQAMFFALLFVAVFAALWRERRMAWPLTLLLPVLVVMDNRIGPDRIKRFDKYASRAEVDKVVRSFRAGYDGVSEAVAYLPVRPVHSEEERHMGAIVTNLSAMLAAQELGLPVVNAYTGHYPGNFPVFFNELDSASLEAWCSFSGADPRRVQVLRNVDQPLVGAIRGTLRAHSGSFVSADLTREGLLVADRSGAGRWEFFVVLRFPGDRCSLMAHDGRFVGTGRAKDDALVADTHPPEGPATFLLLQGPDGRLAFRAANGKYVAVGGEDARLNADADSLGPASWFQAGDLPEGFR